MKRYSLDLQVCELIEKNIEFIQYEEFISCYSIENNGVSVKIYKRNLSDLLISVYVIDSIYYKEYKLSEQISSKIRRIITSYEDNNDSKLENDLESIKNLLNTFNEDTKLQKSED